MPKVFVAISPDGKVSITVAQGDFNAARAAIEQTVQGLRLAGIDFAEVGEIEKHRHDDPDVHVEQHVPTS